MTLEDHAGDVVRKARMMGGISAADAATAGKLTPEQLDAFEQSGTPPTGIDWGGLAAKLDLGAAKLQALAQGWQPAAVDISVWREFRQITTTGDGMSVNCFLVWDEVTRDAALFDTGFDATPIFALIDQHQLNLQHLFITHTHGDHVAALEPVQARYPKIRLHTGAASAPPQHRNRSNDFVHLGSLRINNRATPGHAEDGFTYIVGNFPDDAPGIAVVGDAMFAGSIGGAPNKGPLAKGKIREQILTLPPATLICPGHGPLTTLGEQVAANPFFA
jgi:hydroxyacylglutathione hydrolase